ncbi:MAG: DUF4954 family protein [candidate division KSB1 bacterium]|jgi:NDP-sugar pyrophosphorylase family protein|nr:DUF4954 family protein [candidate division KSB1 bacterium]
MAFRALTDEEIAILEANGCVSSDWSLVSAADGFDARFVSNIEFRGTVQIGALGDKRGQDNSVARLKNAILCNVSIGDGCCIENVHGSIENARIGNAVRIKNIGEIVCKGSTGFGNGVAIEILNEGGGRELRITRDTGAQLAYLSVLYRHDTELMNRLDSMTDAYIKSLESDRVSIGNGTTIKNTKKIINTLIGDAAVIDGVSRLENGTVDSSPESPTHIENDVLAENFIIQKGASVLDGAMLQNCLVGEATRIGKQFSAENSALFANSEGFHSEICSVFAGPYTVTHHRSTLLIAGMFSFYNAGSGTNQSNHMYKLGPVHQGILERGCKTGSSSYLLWPCRVGAFTAIIGKHYANFDTSDLPFAYINEENGKSVIIPGMNFFTAGTLRDGIKWPNRDRRKNQDKLDFIIFDVLSPFTVQKVLNGIDILKDFSEKAEKSQEFVNHKGIRIKRLLLKTGRRYYQLIVDKYFGDVLMKRIEREDPNKIADIFRPSNEDTLEDEWIDVCGLLCTKSRIDSLVREVKSGDINDYDSLHAVFEKIYQVYEDDEWQWFLANYRKIHGTDLCDETPEAVKTLLTRWKDSSLKLLNMVLQDTGKEFEGTVAISYGIDGDAERDFTNVRGTFDANSFVNMVNKNMNKINSMYEELVSRI